MAYADKTARSQKLPSIAGVAAVHALLGYAFISGLATNVIKDVIPIFEVTSIKEPPVPPENKPEPPKQKEATRERVTTPPRAIDDVVVMSRDPVVIVDSRQAAKVDEPVTATLPPEPLPPGKAAGVQVKGDRAAWITTDDYPSAAIRGGEEGIVGISVRIGPDGRVTACTVTASSGHPSLDAATCRLYPRRARFTPALDRAGAPVESSYSDRVRWQLPPD